MGKKIASLFLAAAVVFALNPSMAFADDAFGLSAGSAAPQKEAAQIKSTQASSSSKTCWYSFGFRKSHLSTSKAKFSTNCKMLKGSTIKKICQAPAKIKKKKRSFAVAKTVRFCGSDWVSFRKISRAEAIRHLKSLRSYNYGGVTFKMKNGKMVEMRLGA